MMPPERAGHIVFIGDYLFPEGDAAAIRTLSLARICRDVGFGVTVVGKGRLRACDFRAEHGGHYIDGIRYETMNPRPVTWAARLGHPVERLLQSAWALEQVVRPDTKAVIINASGSARHVPVVAGFCRRRSIPLVGDVCEWYDPHQSSAGPIRPSYLVFVLAFRFVFPRLRNLIVVSTLLERHFAGGGRQLLRIASPVDLEEIPVGEPNSDGPIVLLYSGIPRRKDLLTEVIAGLALLDDAERSRLRLRLVGPTYEDLVALLGDSAGLLERVGDAVAAIGRVPHERALEELRRAHLSVLLRPDKRYAHAGFPSKVAESLAAGTPVLLNFTSDLREYLGDGTAAIEVRDCSPGAVAAALRRVVAMGPIEWQAMRRAARAKAEVYFDYRVHRQAFTEYVGRLR